MFDSRQTKDEIIAAASVQNDRLIEAYIENNRLRDALVAMRDRDDRNGSLPKAYRDIIDAALAPATTGRPT